MPLRFSNLIGKIYINKVQVHYKEKIKLITIHLGPVPELISWFPMLPTPGPTSSPRTSARMPAAAIEATRGIAPRPAPARGTTPATARGTAPAPALATPSPATFPLLLATSRLAAAGACLNTFFVSTSNSESEVSR